MTENQNRPREHDGVLDGKNFSLAKDKPIGIYQFETVTINELGEVVKRDRGQAKFFVEDLGEPSARQEQRQRYGVELEMVSIPSGSFLMGSPEGERNERPQHQVNLAPFFLGKYPVTQIQYEVVMGKNPSSFKGANCPVENVSWNDATEFCRLLSQKTGKEYRLPSEAQWEYACRGGTTRLFYFGPTITTDVANCDEIGYGLWDRTRHDRTTDVGSFPPNAFGLYDMHGNVWEWCQDVWHKNYKGAPTDGSAWESGGDSSYRMKRGGSWLCAPWDCRSAARGRSPGGFSTGFRVVLMPGL